MQQPIYEMGKMLAQTLLNRLEDGENRLKRLVEPKLLMVRSTTAPRA